MAKSATYENQMLALLFNATAITNIAQNGVSPFTVLYVALHTADPSTTAGGGTLGTQNASEIGYTPYQRISVARTTGAGGFTVAGNSVSPASIISFPLGTSGSGTATFWSIGAAASGATEIYYSGAISPSIVCGSGVTPILTQASTVTET
jgi:hypothetical protein